MRAFLCWLVTAAAAASAGSLQELSVEALLDRATRSAIQQRDALASVRADEQYLQQLRQADGTILQARRLESEIAFVQLSGREEWLAFRNVIAVDGKPTGTDTARLEKLFREGSLEQQGNRIAAENAAYNIGRLTRTLNIPTFPLYVLMPQQRGRFHFKRSSRADADGLAVLSYEERHRPTIVRTPRPPREDVPLKGTFAIAPDDGHVARATLNVDKPVESILQVEWRYDKKIGTWVPSEMRERYRRVRSDKPPPRSYDIVTVATYSNYRRFGVDVTIK